MIGVRCVECEDGVYAAKVEEFKAEKADGSILTVPGVTVLRCTECEHAVFPPDAQAKIDAAMRDEQGAGDTGS
jgi:YgiT-type zinc finger domain-containing protein